MHLGLPNEHHIEYVRSIMVALLLWSRSHKGLPSPTFQEEPCEALLSCVVLASLATRVRRPLSNVSMNFCWCHLLALRSVIDCKPVFPLIVCLWRSVM